MDMSEYCGSSYLKLEDVREPHTEIIADVQWGNFNRPDLIFESGNVLSANKTSCRVLAKAYGLDSEKWAGKAVKVYAGKVPMKDGESDAVLVEPITAPTSDGKLPAPKKPKADFSDEIPF